MKDFSKPRAVILLLDSEPVMRAALRDALDGAHYMVVTAADLGEAVNRLAEEPPDLLITRPYINSMPGWMAADYLRTRRPGLPVLIVAGFIDDDRGDARRIVKDYFAFPDAFRREDLVKKVASVFESIRGRGAQG